MPDRPHGTSPEQLTTPTYKLDTTGPTDPFLLKALTDGLDFPIDDNRLSDTEAGQVENAYRILVDPAELVGKRPGAKAGKGINPQPSERRTVESLKNGLHISNLVNTADLLGELASRNGHWLPTGLRKSTLRPGSNSLVRATILGALAERYGVDEEHPFAPTALGPYIVGLAVQIAGERPDFKPLAERTGQLFLDEWKANERARPTYPRALHILARDLGQARRISVPHFDFTTATVKRNPTQAEEINKAVTRGRRQDAMHTVARVHAANMHAKRDEIEQHILRTTEAHQAQDATPIPELPIQHVAPQRHEAWRDAAPVQERKRHTGYSALTEEDPAALLELVRTNYEAARATNDVNKLETLLYAGTALYEQHKAGLPLSPYVQRQLTDNWHFIKDQLIPLVYRRIDAIRAGRGAAVDLAFVRFLGEEPDGAYEYPVAVQRLRAALATGAYAHFGMTPSSNYQATVGATVAAGYAYSALHTDASLAFMEGSLSPTAKKIEAAREDRLLEVFSHFPSSQANILLPPSLRELIDTARRHRRLRKLGLR